MGGNTSHDKAKAGKARQGKTRHSHAIITFHVEKESYDVLLIKQWKTGHHGEARAARYMKKDVKERELWQGKGRRGVKAWEGQ
jgi:hypothetical protein